MERVCLEEEEVGEERKLRTFFPLLFGFHYFGGVWRMEVEKRENVFSCLDFFCGSLDAKKVKSGESPLSGEMRRKLGGDHHNPRWEPSLFSSSYNSMSSDLNGENHARENHLEAFL